MKNTHTEIETTTPPKSGGKWHERTDRNILLTVLSCIILVCLAYYFGWTGPKEPGQQTMEQANDVTRPINEFSTPDAVTLKDRLISCLDDIDKRIMPAFRAGTVSFQGKISPHQVAELQKLSAEPGASQYITLTVQPVIVFTESDAADTVKFKLKPALLQ
ncbi:MAG TPA: hypothetical protein VN604_00130 [Nitrospirota bacterium]|nr:hypothetical protein [Nitrospirota bacterium]